MDWQERIQCHYETLSDQQRKVANFLLKHPDAVVMMTTLSVSRQTRTSEATVSRLCQVLGYRGWSALQQEAQNDLLERRALRKASSSGVSSEPIHTIAEWDKELITQMQETLREDLLDETVNRVAAARRIVVAAGRSSFPLAQYLGHYLQVFLRNTVIVNSGNQWTDELRQVEPDDVIILFFFPRYAKGSFDLAQFAAQHKMSLILVTDSGLMTPHVDSQAIFYVPVYTTFAVDSKAAVMTFIHIFLSRLVSFNKERIRASLEMFEETAEAFTLFTRLDDRNPPVKNDKA